MRSLVVAEDGIGLGGFWLAVGFDEGMVRGAGHEVPGRGSSVDGTVGVRVDVGEG